MPERRRLFYSVSRLQWVSVGPTSCHKAGVRILIQDDESFVQTHKHRFLPCDLKDGHLGNAL